MMLLILQPKILDQINSRATSLFNVAQSGSNDKLCNTKGRCKTKPDKIIIGNTINQIASGERSLICLGLPPKIKANSLVKLNVVKALTKITIPTKVGCVSHNPSANLNNAQKLPKGGKPIKPNVPIINAIPDMGRRDHNPPNWVTSWVTLFQTMPPVLITNNAADTAWVRTNNNAVSSCCVPTAINIKPM